MTIVFPDNIEDPDDGFQNDDTDDQWAYYCPDFQWTEEDLVEFEMDDLITEQDQQALAAWWEAEGVRCGTFGRDPNKNPYKE